MTGPLTHSVWTKEAGEKITLIKGVTFWAEDYFPSTLLCDKLSLGKDSW